MQEFASPLLYNHFKAEGDVEFRALLYIPDKPPMGYYDNYYNQPAALRLYVRRVFITDQLDRLLPRYLRFVRGVLDSDSLPINVSREQLQQLSALRTIGKKLVRKVLDQLRKLSQDALGGSEDETDTSEELDDSLEDSKADPRSKGWLNFMFTTDIFINSKFFKLYFTYLTLAPVLDSII